MPVPADIIQSMLMQDGYFVGHKGRYRGGHAISQSGNGTIELFSEQGTLLKAVAIEGGKGRAA